MTMMPYVVRDTAHRFERMFSAITHIMCAGSLRPLTHSPFSHFSFFLLSNFVLMCLKPACVGRISHHGASK